jgi:hypothetical protein
MIIAGKIGLSTGNDWGLIAAPLRQEKEVGVGNLLPLKKLIYLTKIKKEEEVHHSHRHFRIILCSKELPLKLHHVGFFHGTMGFKS